MKRYVFVLKALIISALMIGFTVMCDKEDDDDNMDGRDVDVGNHDQNPMMTIYHKMTDSLDTIEATNDADFDFSRMMRAMHQGGNNMAEYVIGEGNDSSIKEFARKVANESKNELAKLDSFVRGHQPMGNNNQFMKEVKKFLRYNKNQKDLQMLTGDADHDFAVLMIQHHRAEIDLGELLLQYGDSEELKAEIEAKRNQLLDEILFLQNWLLEEAGLNGDNDTLDGDTTGVDTTGAGGDTTDAGGDTTDVGNDTTDAGGDTTDVGNDTTGTGNDTTDVDADTVEVIS